MTTSEVGPSPAGVDPARSDPDPVRAEARRRLEARREFTSHVMAYVVVNTFLIGTWAVTGAPLEHPIEMLGSARTWSASPGWLPSV